MDDSTRAEMTLGGPREVPFSDLESGGRALAARLAANEYEQDILVLGIVLGGVLAGHEVAQKLNAPLDYLLMKKLLAPQGSASLISAVNVAGTLVVDQEFLDRAAKPQSGEDYFLADAICGLKQREQTCRGGRAPANVSGKTIILVDNGVRTGMTMKTSIKALRTLNPRRIIAAAPVGSLDGSEVVRAIADELTILETREPFGNVALWYKRFDRPQDSDVSQFLNAHNPVQQSK